MKRFNTILFKQQRCETEKTSGTNKGEVTGGKLGDKLFCAPRYLTNIQGWHKQTDHWRQRTSHLVMTADILYYYMLRNCSRMMATSQANAAVSLCLSLSLLFCGCNIIYVLLICSFLRYSPVSGHFTPPRLPYCAFYQTSWQLLTVEILQHRSCWTYLLRSTRLTTTFCCRGYRQASALAMLPSTGSANSI